MAAPAIKPSIGSLLLALGGLLGSFLLLIAGIAGVLPSGSQSRLV
jgi:hypothetical protein